MEDCEGLLVLDAVGLLVGKTDKLGDELIEAEAVALGLTVQEGVAVGKALAEILRQNRSPETICMV